MLMWAYDITLDGKHVGDNGDLWFETEEEAKADADDYIISFLEKEYGRPPRDFVTEVGAYDLDEGEENE